MLAALLSPTSLGCDQPDASDDQASDEVGETDTGETDTGETGEPLDSDQDGLSDAQEAELGTDPLVKDTDHDNYWDSWEVIEGTDPLDVESRIYTGYWPYNPDKDALEQGSWASVGKAVGTPFPRESFLDQHGDMVDLYDFTNFTINADNTPAYFIFDLSAQWCGPCHTAAAWISGIDNSDTASLQTSYPHVREKVHGLRIWWITFITQNSAGNAPTLGDSESWYSVHHDNSIPILVDADQDVLDNFGLGFFPHFFLLDPQMRIEYFPTEAQAQANAYSALGLVEALL